MSARFTGRSAWWSSHPPGAGLTAGFAGAGLGDAGAAPASPYAEADGLVQWAECITLPADYVQVVGLSVSADVG